MPKKCKLPPLQPVSLGDCESGWTRCGTCGTKFGRVWIAESANMCKLNCGLRSSPGVERRIKKATDLRSCTVSSFLFLNEFEFQFSGNERCGHVPSAPELLVPGQCEKTCGKFRGKTRVTMCNLFEVGFC